MRFRRRYITKALAAISVVFFVGILMMKTDVKVKKKGGRGRGKEKLEDYNEEEKLGKIEKLYDPNVKKNFDKNGETLNDTGVKKISRREKNNFHKQGDGLVDEDSLIRKDWHDWKVIEQRKLREGPGEQGRKVLIDDTLKRTEEADTRANGFNERISDMVSLDRAVPDIRHPGCKDIKYLEKLPTASIVIPFHNEALSALKRTVHSVFNMSPPELIEEIILVDDYSDRDYLKKELDEYMERFPKVRILRNDKREGLIRTRLNGARVAEGGVVIFLDSHCEANVNWLPPLLERIALNRKRIACPMIDVISNEDFHYATQAGDVMRGAFDWELYYKRIPINEAEMKRRKQDTDPVRSPIMAGGLFAIDRKYFMEELGGYDEGLEVWGGEQYDLSFKVWMCGGEMEEVPCSRVGHIYRKFMSYSVPGGGGVIGRNLQRVVETWMDEWKEHFYRRKSYLKGKSFGDISKQLELRERLKCKNFTWFMTEVAPDILQYYPAIEPEPRVKGPIRSDVKDQCIAVISSTFYLKDCKKGQRHQDFLITWHDDFRTEKEAKQCIDFSNYQPGKTPSFFPCHHGGGNQLWVYNPDSSHIFHPVSGMCLDIQNDKVVMNHCSRDSLTQKWQWNVTDPKKVAEVAKKHPIKFLR